MVELRSVAVSVNAPADAHRQRVCTIACLHPAESAGAFPLTEAQKEIWLAAQMGGDAPLVTTNLCDWSSRASSIWNSSVRPFVRSCSVIRFCWRASVKTVNRSELTWTRVLKFPWSNSSANQE